MRSSFGSSLCWCVKSEKEMAPKKKTLPEPEPDPALASAATPAPEPEPAPALDSAATPALARASEPSYGLSGEAGASPPAPTPAKRKGKRCPATPAATPSSASAATPAHAPGPASASAAAPAPDPATAPALAPTPTPNLCENFLMGRCRKNAKCHMVHEKEVGGCMKRFKTKAD